MIGRYNVRVGHKLIAVLFVDMLFGDVALRRDERFALSAVTHVFGAQRGKRHETHHRDRSADRSDNGNLFLVK